MKNATTDKSERVRMFVALELPEVVLDYIDEWGEQELVDSRLRRIPRESLHVTLAFLGNRPLEDVEKIEYGMELIAQYPILLELEGPVGRPERGQPRLVALPVNSNPVTARQAELSEFLTYEGLYKPDKRPFWPHVTVARVRTGGRGSEPSEALRIPSGPPPTAGYGWFRAVRLSLYRSQPQSSGTRYTPLAQVELPVPGWQ
ncbi:MAG: RNA 2',3'-cyclic phosphodiesterase [Solirubrobacterales bacterium]